jgi:hypothetical protein
MRSHPDIEGVRLARVVHTPDRTSVADQRLLSKPLKVVWRGGILDPSP